MDKRKAFGYLGNFVRKMCADGVRDTEGYREWTQEHLEAMAGLFDYVPAQGKPPVEALVKAFFHPRLDLVGLNYTPVAFNTLHHEFQDGWSEALRWCRGSVFDFAGHAVAVPLPKFFNDHEMPPGSVPERFDVALEKLDGELGIAYHHARKFRINTRGTFTYKTAKIAQGMLDRHATDNRWSRIANLKRFTLLFEVIHPETRKLVDYGDRRSLVLVAANDRLTFEDLAYPNLAQLAKMLGVEVAREWADGHETDALRRFVRESGVSNQEGFVARYGNLRVKFKFPAHLARMREAKLSYGEIMKRYVAGTHRDFILCLPEEIVADGRNMLDKLLEIKGLPDDKARRVHLYSLVSDDQRNSTFKGHCGKFIKAALATSSSA